eukprot:CAMPEP_0204617256 /NCGR_PEP_ID=MMETSP0717-20131115/4285_1 /ASSEMBLY_ACC=CAM_ASM_000666 /TAXON_ID=230516 /ORGANISM="Chaetoceros curvisetus" /LENGTH=148 /DNA_ID=CAMNT_0051630737 /DNA_START=62 /DNA_END=508 /DNA_ORIENTATION=+
MERAFDELTIAQHEVTQINEFAFMLPNVKHSSLYDRRDKIMKGNNDEDCHSTVEVAKDTPMKDIISNKKGNPKINNKKRCKRRVQRHNIKMKTDHIRALCGRPNNLKKIEERHQRREKKERRKRIIEGKRRRKQDMKMIKNRFSSLNM